MAVSFEDIEKKFHEIFGFIRDDLKRILPIDPGGNYAVASLFAGACETLAIYRCGKKEGEIVFAKLLPDGPFQGVAKTLYDALRNGLVHRYRAKDIKVDGKTVEIDIAWKEGQHLRVHEKDGVWHLVLNDRNLCCGLFSAFDEYEAELKRDGSARDRFLDQYGKEKSVEQDIVDRRGESRFWQKILAQDARTRHCPSSPV